MSELKINPIKFLKRTATLAVLILMWVTPATAAPDTRQAILKLVEWELAANPALDQNALKRMSEVILTRNTNLPRNIADRIHELLMQTEDRSRSNSGFNHLSRATRSYILNNLNLNELKQIAVLPAEIFYFEIPEEKLEKIQNLQKFDLQASDYSTSKNITRFYKPGDSQPYIRWFIHPLSGVHAEQMKETFRELFDLDLEPMRGRYCFHFTSSRSLILFSDPSYYDAVSVKLSLPASEGPFKNKSIHLKEWSAWVRHNIYLADTVPNTELPHLKLQQENYGVGFSNFGTEDGFLFRSLKLLKNGRYLLPAFAVFDEQIGKEIARINGSNDPFSYWEQNLIRPLAEGSAELRATAGAQHTSPHSQNILIELDERMRPTGKIVIRDFDFYMDTPVFSKLNRLGLEPDGLTRATQEPVAFSIVHGLNTRPSWLSNERLYEWIQSYFRYYRSGFSQFTGIPESLIFKNSDLHDGFGGGKIEGLSDIGREKGYNGYTMDLSDRSDFLEAYQAWLEKKNNRTRPAALRFSLSVKQDDVRSLYSQDTIPKQSLPRASSHFAVFSSWEEFGKSLSVATSVDQYADALLKLTEDSKHLSYSERKNIRLQLSQANYFQKVDRLLEAGTNAKAMISFITVLFQVDPQLIGGTALDFNKIVSSNFWDAEQKNLIRKTFNQARELVQAAHNFKSGTYHQAMSAIVGLRDFHEPTPELMDAMALRINREEDATLRRYLALELARFAAVDPAIKKYLIGKLPSFDVEERTEIGRIAGVATEPAVAKKLSKPKRETSAPRGRISCEAIFR